MSNSPARTRLAELEAKIEKGLKAWLEVSQALIEIRNERLFLEAGYSSFEKYCWAKHGKTYNWAWKMIQAGEVQKTVDEPLPSVSAALELGRTPPPKRKAVIAGIKETSGKVTAETIQKAVKPKLEAKKQAPKPEARVIVEDGTGLEVPKEALGIWNRQGEIKDLLSQLSGIRSALSRYFESGDNLFVEVDFNEALADSNRLYANLKLALPYAVCPDCNGVMQKGCETCKGRGMVSQFFWDTFVPTEKKVLREK